MTACVETALVMFKFSSTDDQFRKRLFHAVLVSGECPDFYCSLGSPDGTSRSYTAFWLPELAGAVRAWARGLGVQVTDNSTDSGSNSGAPPTMKEGRTRDALTWIAQEARGLLRAGKIDERHAERLRSAFDQLDAAYALPDPLSVLPERILPSKLPGDRAMTRAPAVGSATPPGDPVAVPLAPGFTRDPVVVPLISPRVGGPLVLSVDLARPPNSSTGERIGVAGLDGNSLPIVARAMGVGVTFAAGCSEGVVLVRRDATSIACTLVGAIDDDATCVNLVIAFYERGRYCGEIKLSVLPEEKS